MNYNQFGFKPIEYQSIMCVFIFVDQTLQNYRIGISKCRKIRPRIIVYCSFRKLGIGTHITGLNYNVSIFTVDDQSHLKTLLATKRVNFNPDKSVI